MANTHQTLTSLFTDIANAIRSQTGSTDVIKADDFPSAIADIPKGAEIKYLYKPNEGIDLLGTFTRVNAGYVSRSVCERWSDCIYFECDGNGNSSGSSEKYLTNAIDVSGYDAIIIRAQHYHANNSWVGGHINAVIIDDSRGTTNITQYSASNGTSAIMLGCRDVNTSLKLGFFSSMVVSIISKIWLYEVALIKF